MIDQAVQLSLQDASVVCLPPKDWQSPSPLLPVLPSCVISHLLIHLAEYLRVGGKDAGERNQLDTHRAGWEAVMFPRYKGTPNEVYRVPS